MPIYRFVDAIDASPTTLLDLDDQSPLTVTSASTSPPRRRVSSFGSSARDGDVLSQKSYADRTLTILLKFKYGATAEEQSETIQKIGRLLDDGAWLWWQHDGKIEPVFYRTKYGDIDVDDVILDETPQRRVTLTITAEPFAYGLPETGTVTINNDPTHVTNPMSCVFPAVKGDVATPLALELPPLDKSMYSVTTSDDYTGLIFGQPTAAGTPAGWTRTDGLADSDAVGGTTFRGVKASGSLGQAVAVDLLLTPPGDWRLLVRARSTVVGATMFSTGYVSPATPTPIADGVGYVWHDLGVNRFPQQSIAQSQELPGLVTPGPTTTDLLLILEIAGTSGEIRIDCVLLVPAGLDDAEVSTLLMTSGAAIQGATEIDSLNEICFGYYLSHSRLIPCAGGFPRVLPGSENHLTILPRIYPDPDDLGAALTVDWMYYPRYLYDRPESS